MDKRVLFIANINAADINNSGIVNKHRGQAKAFRHHGFHTDIVYTYGDHIRLNGSNMRVLQGGDIVKKLFLYDQFKEIECKEYSIIWL